MATLADVEHHRGALEDLTTLLIAELVNFWRSLDITHPAAVAEEARGFVPELVTGYALTSSTLAADWYDDLRNAAGLPGDFAALLADPPPTEQVQNLLSWNLAPLFPQDSGVAAEPEAALSRIAGSAQRLVVNADRETIAGSVQKDPRTARYVRHASANACAFCALLATRTAYRLYTSEESALRVTRGRGARALGEKYHDHCHCLAVPVWEGVEVEEAPYVDRWRDAYATATNKLGGASDVRAILALMRSEAGLR